LVVKVLKLLVEPRPRFRHAGRERGDMASDAVFARALCRRQARANPRAPILSVEGRLITVVVEFKHAKHICHICQSAIYAVLYAVCYRR
jgi:hypothetical protein